MVLRLHQEAKDIKEDIKEVNLEVHRLIAVHEELVTAVAVFEVEAPEDIKVVLEVEDLKAEVSVVAIEEVEAADALLARELMSQNLSINL